MSKAIKIGSVSIPLDNYVISGTALLGTKGAGKTYAGKGIAEQLLDAGIPIVAFDPIGRWHFMKIAGTDADRPKGYKIVVAGGERPDLPLSAASAPEIVRAAIRENIPLVLDLYDRKLSKAEWRRIVQSCFRTLLYENKGLRHIFLEETAEFAPQKVLDGETYAEVEKLVRMGGNASLGITLINQRAQEVNKAVLDLCDNLVLMRQRGSHAIEALEKWIDKLDPDSAKTIARAMPTMKQGEAWVFTGSAEAATHTFTGPIKSFHPDRKRPELSARAQAERATDPADFVARLAGELTKVVAEAEANDPKKLRAKIAELERQVRARAPHQVVARVDATPAQIEAAEQRGYQRGAIDAQRSAGPWLKTLKGALHQGVEQAFEKLPLPALGVAFTAPIKTPVKTPVSTGVKSQPARRNLPPAPVTDGTVTPSQQRILNALLWLEDKGIDVAERPTVGALARLKHTTGNFKNYLGSLRSAGLIEYPQDGEVRLTSEGRGAARRDDNTRAVHEQWLEIVSGAQKRILEAVIEAHPEPISRESIGEAVGLQPDTGNFKNYLGALRTLRAIDYPQPGMVALTRYVMP